MRKISYKTPIGEIQLDVAAELVNHVATRNGIPIDSVSDMMLLQFFQEASNVALKKEDTEYINTDGTDT